MNDYTQLPLFPDRPDLYPQEEEDDYDAFPDQLVIPVESVTTTPVPILKGNINESL